MRIRFQQLRPPRVIHTLVPPRIMNWHFKTRSSVLNMLSRRFFYLNDCSSKSHMGVYRQPDTVISKYARNDLHQQYVRVQLTNKIPPTQFSSDWPWLVLRNRFISQNMARGQIVPPHSCTDKGLGRPLPTSQFLHLLCTLHNKPQNVFER